MGAKEVVTLSEGSPVRLALVGLGYWGRSWYTDVLRPCADVAVVGTADVNPAAGQWLKQEDGRSPTFATSVHELLGSCEFEASLVATPLQTHAETVRVLLEAGKHVLVEKPLAPEPATAAALVCLAEQRRMCLTVSQNYRYFPAVRAVQGLVREGILGDLISVDIDFRRDVTTGPRRGVQMDIGPAPYFADMAIHHFDLVRAVTGAEGHEVYATSWSADWSSLQGATCGAAIIRLSTGVVVSYHGSWLGRGVATPWGGSWTMHFEHGDLVWSARGPMTDGRDGERVVIVRNGREKEVPTETLSYLDRAGVLNDFVTAVREGIEPETSGRNNLGSIALMDAAIRSAATGRNVGVMGHVGAAVGA